ncbi:MAG: hypothetical protein EOR22_23580 [Mesorhizobium sp.]|nr:MAG: hypothetical protein EOR22_23580 [Mesorhizobium sp.]
MGEGFQFFHIDDGSDLADRLPPAARAKMLRLREAKIAARDLALPMFDRIREVRLDRVKAWADFTKREESFTHNYNHIYRHYQELPPEGKQEQAAVDQAKVKVARLDEEIARLEAQNEAKQRRSQALGALIDNNLERFLGSLQPGTRIAAFDGIAPKLRKGETAIAAIERIRSERAALLADLSELQGRPITAAAAKARLRAEIAALASAGRPSVLSLADHGEPVGWKHTRLELRRSADMQGYVTGLSIDALGLIAWAFGDELIALLDAEIDATDTSAGISDEDRGAAEFQITASLQSLEREEEALIEMAEAQGQMVERRADADPAAVLGIVVA